MLLTLSVARQYALSVVREEQASSVSRWVAVMKEYVWKRDCALRQRQAEVVEWVRVSEVVRE